MLNFTVGIENYTKTRTESDLKTYRTVSKLYQNLILILISNKLRKRLLILILVPVKNCLRTGTEHSTAASHCMHLNILVCKSSTVVSLTCIVDPCACFHFVFLSQFKPLISTL